MLLQKSMNLLHLVEKEDYAMFTVDVQKLNVEEQSSMQGDLVSLLGGAFTHDATPDLEKALEVVCTLCTPDCRLLPMVEQAIESKFHNLTRILTEALSRDYKLLEQSLQEWMRWDMIVKADRAFVKELKEEEENDDTQAYSSLDRRLMSWLTLCDSIQSTYCMRESVIDRCLLCSSPFVEYLTRVDPLSPIVVSHSLQPSVYSPNYSASELAERLIHYLTRRNCFKKRDYTEITVKSLEYLSDLLKFEDVEMELPLMERVLIALLPTLNDYEMGEERKKSVVAFRSLLLSFPNKYQPLLLKRLVRVIKDRIVNVDAEAQILSFLVDLYRQQLVVKGEMDLDYSSCLPDFWAVIFIKYDDCTQASMFYQSLFLLAGLQARMHYRLDLLKDVQVKVLTPLQQQLADYLQLRKLQEKTDTTKARMDLSFLPTVEDDSLIRLHISVRVMNETFELIRQALIKWK